MATLNRTASQDAAVLLEMEQVERIRHAMLVGLAAFGEIERLQSAQFVAEQIGGDVPADIQQQLKVVHPTGSSETVSDFADALREIERIAAMARAAKTPR